MGIRFAMVLFTLLLASCTQGHCRRKVDAPAEAPPIAPAAEVPSKPSDQDHVFVYKYDGSLQCGVGKPIALEVMARELGNIPILSSTKKADGLMHIQVCGSVTGTANVYEIAAKSLKKAESKGFKKWSFE